MAPQRGDGRSGRWLRLSGIAAAVGATLWLATPWVQTAVVGTRPYVATAFDASSLAGWLLMLAGLSGFRAAFGSRYGRLGRVAVWTTAAGMALVTALLLRRVALFVAAGFRAIPATGEDPAGLVLTLATLLGFGLVLVGAGGIGLALRDVEGRHVAPSWLLLLAPVVPLALIGLRALSVLPLPLGRLVVSTNAALVPFALGWAALSLMVRSDAAADRS